MRCKITGCTKLANKSWATVPICKQHHANIHEENRLYYKGITTAAERVTYNMIRHLTPSGKARAWR